MKQKEYGGYIELDEYSGEEYYPEAWALNSGRAALRLFIRLKKIRKIYLPAFCCDTVREACAAEGILWEYYSVDKDFRPCLSEEDAGNDWVCLVNFYGVFDDGDKNLDLPNNIPIKFPLHYTLPAPYHSKTQAGRFSEFPSIE